jgi:hypothetical protein
VLFLINSKRNNKNGIKFIISAIFILLTPILKANTRDTVLNAVYSKPFIYNVLKNGKGTIFVGTAEGIFEIVGTNLIPYSKDKGYIELGKDDDPIINPDGIKNYKERKYVYLLPYPELALDEFHAGIDNYFYISSGGRIYIFDIVPYSKTYRNHSVRTISENFVGTYSGIYLRRRRLGKPAPKFTDGYIREIDGKAFICYDGLLILDSAIVQTGILDSTAIDPYAIMSNVDAVYRDVLKFTQLQTYFLSATNELFKSDQLTKQPISIYKRDKSQPGDLSLIGQYKYSLYFFDGIHIVKHKPLDNNFDTIATLPEPVLDGKIDERHLFAVTSNGIYVIYSDYTMEKLTKVFKAHTLVLTSGTELAIGTDNGLFHLNTLTKTLSPLILGVEFNRRALFVKDNLLYAGSINGLYTISINDFDLLTKRNKATVSSSQIPFYIYIIIAAAVILIGILLFLLLRNKQKLHVAEDQIKELNVDTLDRAKIEEYVKENLSVASLKSITDHFNTNNSHIYKLIEPEKPGSIIQNLRTQKLVEMRDAGAEISEISRVTGLSESYIRRIKGKLGQ